MGRKFTIFALFYFVFEGKFPVQAPRGVTIFGGLIFGGAYFRNFTVTVSILPEVMYHLVKDSVKGID